MCKTRTRHNSKTASNNYWPVMLSSATSTLPFHLPTYSLFLLHSESVIYGNSNVGVKWLNKKSDDNHLLGLF